MGKASKFKVLRRLANEMPPLNIKQQICSKISGKKLLQKGVTEFKGNPIIENAIYQTKQSQLVPANHEKNMKKIYMKHGANGVKAYQNKVDKCVESFGKTI